MARYTSKVEGLGSARPPARARRSAGPVRPGEPTNEPAELRQAQRLALAAPKQRHRDVEGRGDGGTEPHDPPGELIIQAAGPIDQRLSGED